MSIAFPYNEIAKEMRQLIKSGGKAIYRNSHDPARLFTDRKFDIASSVYPKLNTGVEPIGLYFADNVKEIHPLLFPRDYTSLTDVKYNWFHQPPEGIKPRGLISAVIPPDVKVANFGSKVEWDDYLGKFLKDNKVNEGVAFNPARGKWHINYKELPDNVTYSGQLAEPYERHAILAKNLSTRLLDEGYDAVRFPDTIANQPELFQTVLLSHGNTLAKWRKGTERGAGVLGVGGLTLPNFLDNEQST